MVSFLRRAWVESIATGIEVMGVYEGTIVAVGLHAPAHRVAEEAFRGIQSGCMLWTMASIAHCKPEFRWQCELVNALSKLRELPEGSDSWSPHCPSEPMIQAAWAIIGKITKDLPSPTVAAGSDGTIQIKWRKSDFEISFFVYPDGTLEYLSRSNYSGRKSGDLSLSAVNDLLAEF
jgi:hypothetical protein